MGNKAKFEPGQVVITPAAHTAMSCNELLTALARHLCGDWGDVDQEDRQANERALREGARLLSVYHTADCVTFWIITEADRSVTTILLPDDY